MSAIFKFDFQKRKQLIRFSEVKYLNYTHTQKKKKKKKKKMHATTTFSPKQGETRTSSRPIPHPLNKLSTKKKKSKLHDRHFSPCC